VKHAHVKIKRFATGVELELDLTIFHIDVDPSVNAAYVEWGIDGDVNGQEELALALTEREREDIEEQIWRQYDEQDVD
jgi:hypothetical protein